MMRRGVILAVSMRMDGRMTAAAGIWEKQMQTGGSTMLPVDTKDAPTRTGASMTPQAVIKDGQIKTAGAMTRPAGI